MRFMNGQFGPSCTMKFSLNCQRFLLILGNLFISPPPVSPVAGHQTDNAPLGARLPQGQRFQFIGKHIMNGGTGGTGGRMVGTQIKPRQIMAETTMCRPLEKRRLVAGTSHTIYTTTFAHHKMSGSNEGLSDTYSIKCNLTPVATPTLGFIAVATPPSCQKRG